MRSFPALTLFLVASLFLFGCSGGGPAKVTGTVSLDGKPIEDGRISFLPKDGNGQTAEAVITQGTYQAEVPVGPKTVKIVGMRVVRERPAYEGDPNSPMIKETQNYVPAKFNDNTELTQEVTGSGKIDFDLKSS